MHDKLTKNPAVQHRPVGPTLDVKSLYLSFEDFIAFFFNAPNLLWWFV